MVILSQRFCVDETILRTPDDLDQLSICDKASDGGLGSCGNFFLRRVGGHRWVELKDFNIRYTHTACLHGSSLGEYVPVCSGFDSIQLLFVRARHETILGAEKHMSSALAGDYIFKEPTKIVKMPRSTPAEKGISTQYLLNTLNEFELRGIEMHGIDIAVGGDVVFEAFWAPYDEDTPHIVHSLTKLFTNSAAQVAISEGYMTLDTKMVDVLSEYVSPDGPLENQDKVTVGNLLNMTAGYGRMISGSEWRPLKTSWLEAFFAEPVPYEPGTHYQYSSGNPYAVSAMVQKLTGMTAEDYLMKSGFSALELRNFTWDKSPEGICSGGNGVSATVEDMLKIGQLYLNGGSWNGKQILDPELVKIAIGTGEKLTEAQTTYALHWTETAEGSGIYAAGGSYGQQVIIVPDLDMAICCTAGTSGSPTNVFVDCLIEPTRADRAAGITSYEADYTDVLAVKTASLSLLTNPVFTASPLGEVVDDKEFKAEENKYNIDSIDHDYYHPTPELYDMLMAASEEYDANAPEFDDFIAHGGKMIFFAGWNDMSMSPWQLIQQYRGYVDKYGQETVDTFCKFYLMPSVTHGGNITMPYMEWLDAWCTNGEYPTETVYGTMKVTGGQMPMAAFPGWVKYVGGDPLEGTSYEISTEIPEGFWGNYD